MPKMSSLPEELWTKILELGIQNRVLTYKDLCCISISCRLLHRLSSEDSLWNYLFSTDFPLFPHSSFPYCSSKSLYLLRNKERILIEAAYQQRLVEEKILHGQEQQQKIELSKQRLSRMAENKEIYKEKVVNRRQVEFNRLKREREKMRKLKYYLQLQEAERKKQEETDRLAKLAEIHDKMRIR